MNGIEAFASGPATLCHGIGDKGIDQLGAGLQPVWHQASLAHGKDQVEHEQKGCGEFGRGRGRERRVEAKDFERNKDLVLELPQRIGKVLF
jgi:hypothetical protein